MDAIAISYVISDITELNSANQYWVHVIPSQRTNLVQWPTYKNNYKIKSSRKIMFWCWFIFTAFPKKKQWHIYNFLYYVSNIHFFRFILHLVTLQRGHYQLFCTHENQQYLARNSATFLRFFSDLFWEQYWRLRHNQKWKHYPFPYKTEDTILCSV
jgi:hypothetical protein